MTAHDLSQEDALRTDTLGQALRGLPPAHAPHSLAPRVMAAVRARLAARVPRTWFDLPVMAQVASVVAFVLVIAGLSLTWPLVAGVMDRATSVDGVRVVSVFFRAVWQPLVFWLVAGMTITALLCATCGALLSRIALGGVSR